MMKIWSRLYFVAVGWCEASVVNNLEFLSLQYRYHVYAYCNVTFFILSFFPPLIQLFRTKEMLQLPKKANWICPVWMVLRFALSGRETSPNGFAIQRSLTGRSQQHMSQGKTRYVYDTGDKDIAS